VFPLHSYSNRGKVCVPVGGDVDLTTPSFTWAVASRY